MITSPFTQPIFNFRNPSERKEARPENDGRKVIMAPYFLTDKQIKSLSVAIPEVKFLPKFGAESHAHACCALERAYVENEMCFYLFRLCENRNGSLATLEKKANTDPTNFRIVDVGGSVYRHQAYRRQYMHTCMPLLDQFDYNRQVGKCGVAAPSCRCAAPDCPHILGDSETRPADATMSVHVYTLSRRDILSMCLATTTGTHLGAFHVFNEAYGMRGSMYGGEAKWQINPVDDTIAFWPSGGSGYNHAFPSWLYSDNYYQNGPHAMEWSVHRHVGYTYIYRFTLCGIRPPRVIPPCPFVSRITNPNDWGDLTFKPPSNDKRAVHTLMTVEHKTVARIISFGPYAVTVGTDNQMYWTPKEFVDELILFAAGLPRDVALYSTLVQHGKQRLNHYEIPTSEKAAAVLCAAHVGYTATLQLENALMAQTLEESHWDLQRHKKTAKMVSPAIGPADMMYYCACAFLAIAALIIAVPFIYRSVAVLWMLVQAWWQLAAPTAHSGLAFYLLYPWASYLMRFGFQFDTTGLIDHASLFAFAAASCVLASYPVTLPLALIVCFPFYEEMCRRVYRTGWYFSMAVPISEIYARGPGSNMLVHAVAPFMDFSSASLLHILHNGLVYCVHLSTGTPLGHTSEPFFASMWVNANPLFVAMFFLALAFVLFTKAHLSRGKARLRFRARGLNDEPWQHRYGYSPPTTDYSTMCDITSRSELKTARAGSRIELPEFVHTGEKANSSQALGPLIAGFVPRIYASNIENEKRALINRQMMVPPGIKYPYANLIHAWVHFYFDDIFPGWKTVAPFQRKAWCKGQKDCAQLENAYSQLASHPGFYRQLFRRSIFVKREPKNCDSLVGREEGDPRNITSALPHYRVLTGPWVAAFQSSLKKIWNIRHFITFACGIAADDLGHWVHSIERTHEFADCDASRFDASLTNAHLELELSIMKRFGADDIHVMPGYPTVYELVNCMSNVSGFSHHGIWFLAHGTRKSGDGWTTPNNTLHTGCFDALFAICHALGTTPRDIASRQLGPVAPQTLDLGGLSSDVKDKATPQVRSSPLSQYPVRILAGGDDLLTAFLPKPAYRAPPQPSLAQVSTRSLLLDPIDAKDSTPPGRSLEHVHIPFTTVKDEKELASMFYASPERKAEHPDWEAYGLAYGLRKKINVRGANLLEFYSCRAWPVNHPMGRVLGPKPGRVLSKFLVTCDKPDNLEDHEYIRGVLASVQHAWHHVPVLRVVWAVFCQRYGSGSSKYVAPPPEWALSFTQSYDVDEVRAAYMFQSIYGVPMRMVEKHVYDLYQVAKVGQAIDSPLLRRLAEVDAPIDA